MIVKRFVVIVTYRQPRINNTPVLNQRVVIGPLDNEPTEEQIEQALTRQYNAVSAKVEARYYTLKEGGQ